MSEIETKQYNTYFKKFQKNWGDIFDIPLSIFDSTSICATGKN